MKKLFSIILLSIAFSVFAAEVKYIGEDEVEDHNHYYYELQLDTVTHNPAWVKWTLTADEAIEAEAVDNRTNNFRKCNVTATKSSIKADYNKTGFDRGHMCPNNDMDFSVDGASTTFFMCNMCPQTPALNRGIWKKYEEKGHKLAKKYGQVEIICGPTYDDFNSIAVIGKTGVYVPSGFYKVFIYNDVIECYLFTQENKDPAETTLEKIFELTKISISK